MARPTVLKLEGGEITFRNLPKERIDQIKGLILDNKQESQNLLLPPLQINNAPSVQAIPENAELVLNHTVSSDEGFEMNFDVVLELKNTAIGFRKDSSGSFHIDTVKYDVETKVAKLENSEFVGKSLSMAEPALKVKVVKQFL